MHHQIALMMEFPPINQFITKPTAKYHKSTESHPLLLRMPQAVSLHMEHLFWGLRTENKTLLCLPECAQEFKGGVCQSSPVESGWSTQECNDYPGHASQSSLQLSLQS